MAHLGIPDDMKDHERLFYLRQELLRQESLREGIDKLIDSIAVEIRDTQ